MAAREEPADFLRRFAESAELRTDVEAQQRHAELTSRASVCSYCGVGCSFTVQRDEGSKERLVPLSDLGLCVKGLTSLETGGDLQRRRRLEKHGIADDRIRAPMIRGHDGKMEVVSWERALDRAAWLFLHIREWIGPTGIAMYGNGQQTVEAIWMECLYKLVFQISTLGANSEHCLASAGAGHTLNFGNEASFTWHEFEELALADVIVMHGTNPLVTFPQAFAKAKRNEAAVKVVIDPVRSHTVVDLQASDPRTLHIRFEQGGDVLFNMAVAHEILMQGWEDRAYLERAVDPASRAAFEAMCLEPRFAVDTVARRIALEGQDVSELAATIRAYARLIARPNEAGERPKPAFVSSMGINQSTGSYGFSTNLNLLLLTGNVGRRGAGSMRIAGQSNATSELMLGMNSRKLVFNLDPANPAHRRELAELLDIPEHNIPRTEGTPVARMSEDDHLYCFLFLGTQMTRNMPRLGQWKRRLGRAYNIVIDSFLPEGALDHADVILPALTYTERTGVIQRGDRTLQLQQGISEPPALAWSDEQILARLALTIAARLRDTDTAALNDLDPDVITRAFGRYLQADGSVRASDVFDHVVSTSRALDVYNRLEDEHGTPISHALLKQRAGLGVQWQGDGRYAHARSEGNVFPGLRQHERRQARLVRPPEELLANLVARGDEQLRSLITGRGRPGKDAKLYVRRYNSGIKSMAIAGRHDESYAIQIHPSYAAREGLAEGDAVRMSSQHGVVIGTVSLNENAPVEFPFLDFVAGETNRLTDYLDSDRFTNQSLIKRTPVRLEKLGKLEAALWQEPERAALLQSVERLYAHYRAVYPDEQAMERAARGEPGAPDWLPWEELRKPRGEQECARAEAVGAMATFVQRYMNDAAYRARGALLLATLPADARERLLYVLLPLLRRIEYDNALLTLLSDLVGGVPMLGADERVEEANLLLAHKSAVLELKEEVVAVQLFVAIKAGIEALFGRGRPVPREDLALISGIAIPCAGDVPAYFMGITPADLDAARLVHSRATGTNAVIVVDRRRNLAVKVDVVTGVLPKDKELIALRSKVIVKKRSASKAEHRRFFDRLAELVAQFVRVDAGNFRLAGPVALPWREFTQKLSFVPAAARDYRDFLLHANLSPALVQGLVGLEMLDAQADSDLIERLQSRQLGIEVGDCGEARFRSFSSVITDSTTSAQAKVREVIDSFIGPVLDNDGGRINLVGFDESTGEVSVRFVGSCANCPCSMLSLETLVAPPLLNIPGVTRVLHRGRLRQGELERARGEQTVQSAPKTRRALQVLREDPPDLHGHVYEET
ncbi:MAG: molybdopterin-dependent oxidoreductase [Myxococcales bacterium]